MNVLTASHQLHPDDQTSPVLCFIRRVCDGLTPALSCTFPSLCALFSLLSRSGVDVNSISITTCSLASPHTPLCSPSTLFLSEVRGQGTNEPSFSFRSGSSTSSLSTSRSFEATDVRQPSKSRIRHHTNRLSGVFLRGPASSSGAMALTSAVRSTLSAKVRKGSGTLLSTALMVDW